MVQVLLTLTYKGQYGTRIVNFNISLHKPYNRINYKTAKLQLTIQWLSLYIRNYLSLTDSFARWCTDDKSALCRGRSLMMTKWTNTTVFTYFDNDWYWGKLSRVTKSQGLG